MLKIKVLLYGTLPKGFPGYDPGRGLEVELAEGSSAADLVEHLKIPAAKLGLISVQGALVKAHTKLKNHDCVRIYQPIAGG